MLRPIRILTGVLAIIGILLGFMLNLSPKEHEGSAGRSLLICGTALLLGLLISLTITERRIDD